MKMNWISGISGCLLVLALFGSWILFAKIIVTNKRRAFAIVLLKYLLLMLIFYALSKLDLLNTAFFIGTIIGIALMLVFALYAHRTKLG